jgi:hypothetical protein
MNAPRKRFDWRDALYFVGLTIASALVLAAWFTGFAIALAALFSPVLVCFYLWGELVGSIALVVYILIIAGYNQVTDARRSPNYQWSDRW